MLSSHRSPWGPPGPMPSVKGTCVLDQTRFLGCELPPGGVTATGMTQHTGDRTLRAPGGMLSIYGMTRAPCTTAHNLSSVKGIFWGSGSVVLEQAPREGPTHLHTQERPEHCCVLSFFLGIIPLVYPFLSLAAFLSSNSHSTQFPHLNSAMQRSL